MSIESSSPAPHSKAAAGVSHDRGKKLGKPDAGVADSTGGFLALINSLSTTDIQEDVSVDTTLPLVTCDAVESNGNMPLALENKWLYAINVESQQAGTTAAPAIVTAMTQLASSELTELSASGAVSGGGALLGLAGSTGIEDSVIVALALPAQPSSLSPATPERLSVKQSGSGRFAGLELGETAAPGQSAPVQLAAEQSFQTQKDSFSGQRIVASHPQALSAVQIELREAKLQTAVIQQSSVPDVTTALNMPGLVDMLSSPTNRPGVRLGSSLQGAAGSGFEGLIGAGGRSYAPTEAAFKVEAPSAVVSETAIAETVSYWVTHGVQSAELTLDGFDSTPVEISIVLNGDQARIEFRTDQADMRQVLENAKNQLKDLLSDQGLQLSGLSVGTSGAGAAPGDGRQQKPTARQAVWVAVPQAAMSVGRSANPSVGRSVDLFV